MIENKAWGDLTDRSSSQGQSQADDDMDYSFEDSVQEEEEQMDRQQSPPVSPRERSIPCSVNQLSQSIQHSLHLQSDFSPEMSMEDDDEEERDPDIYDDDDENSNPDSEEDRYLPELTISLADPEASHFDELLFYVSSFLFFSLDTKIHQILNFTCILLLQKSSTQATVIGGKSFSGRTTTSTSSKTLLTSTC